MLNTLLGVIALLMIVGVAGTLEQSCDRTEWALRGMEEGVYYTIMEHLADSTGHQPTRQEIADYYLANQD